MKWIWQVLLKIQSGHDSAHRRTDGQCETSIPPFNFIEARVINNDQRNIGREGHSKLRGIKESFIKAQEYWLRFANRGLCPPPMPRWHTIRFAVDILISALTHWGRVTHICISKFTIIGSDNGLPPGRRQAIIWNNAGLLLIERLGTNFSEISIGIQTFSFKKMLLNMSSGKCRPFCLGLNVLMIYR